MKNEKVRLIIIFILFFFLSSLLIYMMIKKDIKIKDEQIKKMEAKRGHETMHDNWPKVEIETRK